MQRIKAGPKLSFLLFRN